MWDLILGMSAIDAAALIITLPCFLCVLWAAYVYVCVFSSELLVIYATII